MELWKVMVYNGAATGRLHEIYAEVGIFSSQARAEQACIGRRNYSVVGPVPLDHVFQYRALSFDEAGMVGYWPEVEGYRVIKPEPCLALRHPEDVDLAPEDTPWPWEVTADLVDKAPGLVRDFDLLYGEGSAGMESATDGGDER